MEQSFSGIYLILPSILHNTGLGYADVENRVPCTPSTVLRVASISKSFSMVLAAKLMEEGKLDIDKDVRDYVPTFPQKIWEGEKVCIEAKEINGTLKVFDQITFSTTRLTTTYLKFCYQ